MSDKHKDKDAKGNSGKGKLMLILVAVGMLTVGGGGVFALVATGVLGGSHASEHKERGPQLVRKGEEDPYMPKAKEGADEAPTVDVEGEGGDEYRKIGRAHV